MIRWITYCLMAASLGAAVLLNGGAHPQQWQWCALGVSLGAILCVFSGKEQDRSAHEEEWGIVFLALLAAWMLVQWLPIPPWALERLAPDHWNAIAAARASTGFAADEWAT